MVYRGSRKQRGGRSSRKPWNGRGGKQKGGFLPILSIPPLILAGLKAAGAAAALGAASAAGHHTVDAVANKIRGGGGNGKRSKRKKC